MRLADLRTPALLVEQAILLRNLDGMARRARQLGVTLRPHVKTHKCVEIARLQRERGASGLTVSTLEEAEAFAAAGFTDLTWAFPLPHGRLEAALDLAARITLRFVLDDPGTLSRLERAAAFRDLAVHAWLKVDCGYHRAGVDPDRPESADLAARLAQSSSLRFDGLLTHAGHSYQAFDRAERLAIARREREALTGLAARLAGAGIDVPRLSLGSTPTLTIVEDLEGIHEARPGNYVYYDLTQAALGSCAPGDIALSVLATVVSHPPGAERAIVDAGALALSKDAGPPAAAGTFGGICPDPLDPRPDPLLRLESISQEHGTIRPGRPGALAGKLPVGARLRILPNHSCLTSACFDRLHLVDGDDVLSTWAIHRER
jgi:D-serine deaminase-like pyridoxal phosphate-dependent protein